MARAPGFKLCGVKSVFTQSVAGARKIALLNRRLVFKLLHKVAVPAQAAREAAQVVGQLAFILVFGGNALRYACLGGLVHLAHGDGAKGQVGG